MPAPRPDSGMQRALAKAHVLRLQPTGFSNRDLCAAVGCSEKVGKKAIAALRAQGQLFTLPFGCNSGQQALYFGTQHQLQQHAATLAPRPESKAQRAARPSTTRPPLMRERLSRALQQAKWQGLTPSQAMQAIGTTNPNNISRPCKELAAMGVAEDRRHSGRLLMFAAGFANQTRIEAWQAETRHAIADAAKRGGQTHAKRGAYAAHQKPSIKRHCIARPAGQAAPVTLGQHGLQGDADDSRARITRVAAPLWDARYEIDPATRIEGGFAAAGIGRYLSREQLEAPC